MAVASVACVWAGRSCGIGAVGGFRMEGSVAGQDLIGAEDQPAGPFLRDAQRLHLGQGVGDVAVWLALGEEAVLEGRFVDSGTLDLEGDADLGQELGPDGGAGGENDGDGHVDNPRMSRRTGVWGTGPDPDPGRAALGRLERCPGLFIGFPL